MQRALERVSKTIHDYLSTDRSRSLATIELVSAFKVVCKDSDVEESELQQSVASYVEVVLTKIDDGTFSGDQAYQELARTYEAAFNKDPEIMNYIAAYT